MANYKLSDKGELDILIVELLKQYFFEDIKWETTYRQFGKLSISKVHPFVRLLSDTRRNKPKDVLPAITVALVGDDSSSTTLSKATQTVTISKSLRQELQDQKYGLNKPNAFRELLDHIDGLAEGKNLYGKQTNRRYNQRLLIEIWADNDEIKDNLYEGVKDFIDFYGKEIYGYGLENPSVNGKKDGDYNFDFGLPLYGATINLSGIVCNLIFDIDTDIVSIAGIKHHIDDTPDDDTPDFTNL